MEKGKVLAMSATCSLTAAFAYNLAIPSFIDSGQVFRSLFNERQHDQTKELIRNSSFDNIFDADNEENSEHGNDGKRQHNSDDTLRECEFRLRHVLMMVKVGMLISFQDFIENGVLRASVIEDEATYNKLDMTRRRV